MTASGRRELDDLELDLGEPEPLEAA
jgi:hypothetical protein